MNFYKVITPFLKVVKEGSIILLNSRAHPHSELVVLSTPSTAGRDYSDKTTDYNMLEYNNHIVPLTHSELWKASHHMSWRIWTMDASPLLNSTASTLDALDILSTSARKVRLIPPAICFTCMKKGNPFIVKEPQIIDKWGTCHVCGSRDTLRATAYASPLNFRMKHFGRFIAPLVFTEDPLFYKDKFIVEDWWQRYGYKEPNECHDGYEMIDGHCQKGRELLLSDLQKAVSDADDIAGKLSRALDTINQLEAEKESLLDILEEQKSIKQRNTL